MAAHSAAMSMSKIINPFWGGRLGSTVKVSQDTSLLSRRSWSLLCSSILKSVILSEHKVIWLISDSWIDKLASLFHTTTLRLSWLHSGFAEQPRHTCNLIHSQTHYKSSLYFVFQVFGTTLTSHRNKTLLTVSESDCLCEQVWCCHFANLILDSVTSNTKSLLIIILFISKLYGFELFFECGWVLFLHVLIYPGSTEYSYCRGYNASVLLLLLLDYFKIILK